MCTLRSADFKAGVGQKTSNTVVGLALNAKAVKKVPKVIFL